VSVAVTAGRGRPRWTILLRPRWLAWHAVAVLATAGMLWLGDWQLHRAESGNELSWAYTFEWPLFAIFGCYFWAKSLRDELRSQAHAQPTGANAEPPGANAEAPGANAKPSAAAGRTGMIADPADEAPGPMAAAAAAAYVERLKSEVRGHGKWHGWR
jgi:hypothetical protein